MTVEQKQKTIDLFSLDKLIEETRQLATKYRHATGNTLPVTSEIARYDVAKALELDLIEDLTAGYDAVGKGEREGLKILIKGRVIFEDSHSKPRIGQIKHEAPWDNVVMVLFDENYNPIEMYEATREDMEEALESKPEKRKRGAMSVAQFKIISDLVWTVENGLETALWDNGNSQ